MPEQTHPPMARQTRKLTQTRRMQWWHDGRFGLFLHWGLYAQLGVAEWTLNREKIPAAEYEPLADTWKPRKDFADRWARLAQKAGMKYIVLTTKHCEGFHLWDTKLSGYNAAKRGPGRDLVAEYVRACRRHGIRVGLYFSLMDWHHPDAEICEHDEAARLRYVQYIHEAVRELMTRYGKIDILWYDGAWPLSTADKLDSRGLSRMVRRLQPNIIINCRAGLPEDFDTSECHIAAGRPGRAWEACMTFNGEWGHAAYRPPEDWLSVRHVLEMLRQVTYGGGNLLLNVGPEPDGTIPREAVERLTAVGKWLAVNGEAVYGKRRADPKRYLDWTSLGRWTRKGNTAYYWVSRWPGRDIPIAGLQMKVQRASFLATGRPISFREEPERIILTGLPKTAPDKIAGVTIIKLECASLPHQELGMGRAAVDMP